MKLTQNYNIKHFSKERTKWYTTKIFSVWHITISLLRNRYYTVLVTKSLDTEPWEIIAVNRNEIWIDKSKPAFTFIFMFAAFCETKLNNHIQMIQYSYSYSKYSNTKNKLYSALNSIGQPSIKTDGETNLSNSIWTKSWQVHAVNALANRMRL